MVTNGKGELLNPTVKDVLLVLGVIGVVAAKP